MIDFSKKLKGTAAPKAIDPIQIYNALDRQSAAGPLRPVQSTVLGEWFSQHQNDKDVIIKLHTGEGKTLIGLLALQSRLNSGKGPCLYVCPNKQLAKQVSLDAVKFGIKFILDQGGDLPIEFTEGKEILITYVQRVFNGKSKFGLDNRYTNIGTIVLDDSHACIDSVKGAFSIKASRKSEVFNFLLSLFETSLRQQGEGSFLDIKNKDDYHIIMPVPYWDWIDKKQEVAEFLSEHQDDDEIKFAYPLLKDILVSCTAYFTGAGVEICPDYNLVQRFTFFVNCGQRILMSATTQDDSFFIKGLGFNKDSVLNPITNRTGKWSGEKMILFPTRIDESLTALFIRDWFAVPSTTGLVSNVALLPSFYMADEYSKRNVQIAVGPNLDTQLEYLKGGVYKDHSVAFVNRYDGIDLPDNQCRLLVIDSLPFMGNLSDRYEIDCRDECDLITTKIAQKVEQGLGRSVRSEKDYSVILIIGDDLVRFIKTSNNQKFFSPQTRKQIEIGEEVTESVKESLGGEKPIKALIQVINQCLARDPYWKQYYEETMNTISEGDVSHPFIDLFVKEFEAEQLLAKQDYASAEKIYQDIANSINNSNLDKGWYTQIVAKCEYFRSKIESEKIQKRAHDYNPYLLMPINVHYKPIGNINQTLLGQVATYLKKQKTYDDLLLKVNQILSELSFGTPANKFEAAMKEIGCLLGFISERPDQQYKKGPDNLWMAPKEREFIIVECKNEVLSTRKFISKEEVGQMNNHKGWFDEMYPDKPKATFIHLHSVNTISSKANYVLPVKIMTPEKLDLFKEAIRGFVREFSKYDICTVEERYINQALVKNQLCMNDIVAKYTVDPVVESN